MPRKRLTHKRAAAREDLELHQGSRRVIAGHPPACCCRTCRAGLLLELEGIMDDLDSMEDEDEPYIWNRRSW